MVLVTTGKPLQWDETKSLVSHVRKHGLLQFVHLYNRLKDRQGDVLKWGDEIEYTIVKFDHAQKKAFLSLRSYEILLELMKEQESASDPRSLWGPEYAAYMIEGTPGKPYGGLLAHFNVVEANMKARRDQVASYLLPDERLMSITGFPRLGSPNFTWPATECTPNEGATRSLFFPDAAIYKGIARFATLSQNIRERRGEKVAINVPIFRDEQTANPFTEDFSKLGDGGEASKAAKIDHVYMDAMGFGMGRSCLQVTFQACNINEARHLYDQLVPLCPLLLALTASSPISRGYLTDIDVRWNIVAGSVDCRTREERGLEPLKHNEFVIPKSRYDSVSCYLSSQGDPFNDVPVLYRTEDYRFLLNSGIDPLLSRHIAHLFIRDSVSLFKERIDQNDEIDTDHFENINSTNWQTMRFKPPPPNSKIGWRVEFRPCEVQITDFENAAFICFIALLTRVILSFGLNFLIPISRVDENMKRAQCRDAVITEKFWFRCGCASSTSNNKKNDISSNDADIADSTIPNAMTRSTLPTTQNDKRQQEPEIVELSIDEIINGKPDCFSGLVPLMRSYLSSMDVDADTHCTIERYMKLIQRRASGELLTCAKWMREFVRGHPDYRKDSVVSERINYDLLTAIDNIQQGRQPCQALFGQKQPVSRTTDKVPEAIRRAENANCPDSC